MCVPGVMYVCARVMYVCARNHVYVCQGSCICVPGVMYVCARGHVSVCHGTCMCVLRVMYVCARGIEFTALSTIIRLYFGTVPTVRYFSVFFLFIYIFNL